MPYKIDYLEDCVVEWSLSTDGATSIHREDYTPTIYVSGESREHLADVTGFVDRLPEVVSSRFDDRRTVWRDEPEPVLRLDLEGIAAVTDVASDIRG